NVARRLHRRRLEAFGRACTSSVLSDPMQRKRSAFPHRNASLATQSLQNNQTLRRAGRFLQEKQPDFPPSSKPRREIRRRASVADQYRVPFWPRQSRLHTYVDANKTKQFALKRWENADRARAPAA